MKKKNDQVEVKFEKKPMTEKEQKLIQDVMEVFADDVPGMRIVDSIATLANAVLFCLKLTEQNSPADITIGKSINIFKECFEHQCEVNKQFLSEPLPLQEEPSPSKSEKTTKGFRAGNNGVLLLDEEEFDTVVKTLGLKYNQKN